MKRWGEKRYHSLDYYLKSTYGEKLYKIALNGGMTCPNRDGTLGNHGCIFCSEGGSGDFASPCRPSVSEQLQEGKSLIEKKHTGQSYIAYFQAYTNTYAPVSYLESLFTEAIQIPEVRILSIATRPDCLGPDVLELLGRLRQYKPVWVELGLQTIHEDSARFIRRGYELPVFDEAVKHLRSLDIDVIVHTILGLPGETKADMLETAAYLNTMDIQGIKLQLLHILKGSDLATLYETSPFYVLEMDEYIDILLDCIAHLSEDIVIHRLTGDGPKQLLIAPTWSASKRFVLNTIHQQMKEQDIWQGKHLRASGQSITPL